MMRTRALCLGVLAALILAGPASSASLFYIRGGGNGHGIGMSQYGAYGYALRGDDYRFILGHYYQGTSIGATAPGTVVRVLLSTGAAAFAGATNAAGKTLNPSLTYDVRALASGSLVLSDHSGKKLGTFSAPLVAAGPAPLSVGGLGQYRGALEFRPDGSGGVETVNAVGLDDYLRGVVAAEMPSSWPAQALEAQAVAARTYALMSDVGGSAFGLYRDTRSQVYGGVAAETPGTDAAVAATSGQVVTYNGVPVVTYFFSSSGGHTESVENVWPGATPEPWLRGVPDPYDAAGGDSYHRWGRQMTTAAAAAKLRTLGKGRLIGIRIVERGVSPRIVLAEIVGTRGRTTVTGTELQQIFGLLSTYAAFTTISTVPGPPAAPAATARVHGGGPVAALISLVHQLAAGTIPTIKGRVFPAGKHATITVQVRRAGRWRPVAKARLKADGTFSVQPPGKGTYRIVYRGLDGPAVNIP